MASNRSHLFPIKALTLLLRLQNVGAFDKATGRTCGGPDLNYPDDGLLRLPLMSPEVHWAVDQVTGMPNLRKRLAIPQSMELKYLSQAKLEYYDIAGTLACEPIQLTELDATISLAVEVELMAHVLDAVQQGIPLM